MPTHFTVHKNKPEYCSDEWNEPSFDSVKEARAYRATKKNAKSLNIWICIDADRFHSTQRVPDHVPDDWTHWNWNGTFVKDKFHKSIIYICWSDNEVIYRDGMMSAVGEDRMLPDGMPKKISMYNILNMLQWSHGVRPPHCRSLYTAYRWNTPAPDKIPLFAKDLPPEVLEHVFNENRP